MALKLVNHQPKRSNLRETRGFPLVIDTHNSLNCCHYIQSVLFQSKLYRKAQRFVRG